MKTSDLKARLRILNSHYPLPDGHHYEITSDGGNGAPRYYHLAVVRDDYQDGERYSTRNVGGLPKGAFVKFLDGIIEAAWLTERVGVLKPVRCACGNKMHAVIRVQGKLRSVCKYCAEFYLENLKEPQEVDK